MSLSLLNSSSFGHPSDRLTAPSTSPLSRNPFLSPSLSKLTHKGKEKGKGCKEKGEETGPFGEPKRPSKIRRIEERGFSLSLSLLNSSSFGHPSDRLTAPSTPLLSRNPFLSPFPNRPTKERRKERGAKKREKRRDRLASQRDRARSEELRRGDFRCPFLSSILLPLVIPQTGLRPRLLPLSLATLSFPLPFQTDSHLTSHISHLTSHISHLTSHISHLTSHISHLTSHGKEERKTNYICASFCASFCACARFRVLSSFLIKWFRMLGVCWFITNSTT